MLNLLKLLRGRSPWPAIPSHTIVPPAPAATTPRPMRAMAAASPVTPDWMVPAYKRRQVSGDCLVCGRPR